MAEMAQSQKLTKLQGTLEVGETPPQSATFSDRAEVDERHGAANETANIVGPGDLCKVKVLYEGLPKCNCCINWVENEPENLKESIEEQTESKKHALLIRKKKNHGEGKPLVLDSIVVQNTYLKELLGQVFNAYSGITTTLKKLVFRSPFHEFFHEWKSFKELCESPTEPEKRSLRLLLFQVLAAELEEKLLQSEDLAANGVVTYDYLWTIFRPGIEVYSTQSGHDCIYKLIKTEYREINEQQVFVLDVQYVDCNGQEFGWKSTALAIWGFSGTRPLLQLETLPTSLYPHIQELKATAEARGRASRSYQTVAYHYAAYHGTSSDSAGNKFNINKGRIVIDAAAYELFNPQKKVSLNPLNSVSMEATIDVSERSHETPQFSPDIYCTTGLMSQMSGPGFGVQQKGEPELIDMDKKKKSKLPSLDDKFLYLCSPEVRGYCLQTKKWATFDVDIVEPIRWQESAFQSLVIGEDYKRLILAFVESQVANKDNFDDVIEGKGRGLIMLLEGSPGVGKTLTGEAVADRVKKPLYALSGGELGQDARQLEYSLSMILEVATKWDAVLLLDECDVFLEKRSTNNLHRNSTVAVFLRLLEYYRGILFMTTNRVNTIDPAFQSRIHLTIAYPKLDQRARQQVWSQFLRRHCRDANISDEDIQELSRVEMNGREIKNLVKTAQLLARHENRVLTAEHFRIVTRVFKPSAINVNGHEDVGLKEDGSTWMTDEEFMEQQNTLQSYQRQLQKLEMNNVRRPR